MSRSAEALYRAGDAAHDAGDWHLAERLLRGALKVDPTHWFAGYTLAVVLQDTGRHAEAATLYPDLLARRPEHARAWNNYGAALQHVGTTDEAIKALRTALSIDPSHAGARANLANLLAECGEIDGPDGARAVLAPLCDDANPTVFNLRRALLINPIPTDVTEIAAQRKRMRDELLALVQRPPIIARPLQEIGRTPFYLAYQPEANRELLELLAEVYRRACPSLSYVAPHCAKAARSASRVRIGFASFFFYEHSVGRVVRGLVEHLPRDRFEVVVIFLGGRASDGLATAMADAAEVAVDTPYELCAARERIAELELDVLCLPDFGMDPLSYFLGFARLAAVQCTTWGHADTSGLKTIDWFVSTEHWERIGAEADYTERLHRLSGVGSPAFYYRPRRQSGGRSALPVVNGTTFFCPQSLYKIHPDLDSLFADILRADARARLVLVRSGRPEWNAALARRLDQRLAAQAKQVEWIDPMTYPDYLATLGAADVVLDPVHFCGGNTSFEALALGKPLVTLEGRCMRSRFTAGLYRAMALDDFISHSHDDYVRRAIDLGSDAAMRAKATARIEETSEKLFEDRSVIDGWADFLVCAFASRR